MRLLNELLENESFEVDQESVGYIVIDIINMNGWNSCEFLIGYNNNKRLYSKSTQRMKLIGALSKEYYRLNIHNNYRDVDLLKKQLEDYITGEGKALSQLKYFSAENRKTSSQYYHKNGESTWLDCTSRVHYAWVYIAQKSLP